MRGIRLHIQTVSGPIEPAALGPTLMHEHVQSLLPGAFYSGGDATASDDLITGTLRILPELGVGCLVDLTGRSGAADGTDRSDLVRLSAELGIHLVAGFASYKDPWLGSLIGATDVDLTARFIESVVSPFDGVSAGIFGEVGTSLNRVTPNEELQLRSVAQAHAETGVAISTHCTLGTMGMEQVVILRSNGADLTRVIIGHVDLRPHADYLVPILDAGANIAFDTFGKETFDYVVPDEHGPTGEIVKHTYHRSDHDRLLAIVELCRRGYDGQIVLSCDMSGAEAWLNPSTHGRYGHSYLFRVVIPALAAQGVSDRSIDRMLIDNPRRILTIP